MRGEKKYLLLVLVVERKKGKKREKEIEEEGEKEKGNERKEDSVASLSDFLPFNGRSSLGPELKSVYATRATLQEVGILPPLGYFHHKGYLAGFL